MVHGDEVQLVQAEQADAALVVGVFDGLPQRCILLVRGVRARRGGVAREARAESGDFQDSKAGGERPLYSLVQLYSCTAVLLYHCSR